MKNHSSKDYPYDVIIVGAGPAGSAAALYAARAGLKTVLLEKEQFPRDKICGDALSGKSVAILRDLNLIHEVGGLPGAFIDSVVFSGPDHTSFRINLGGASSGAPSNDFARGFVIQRRIFDDFLYRRVKETPTYLRENFSVTDLIIENGQVCGVRGKSIKSENTEEFYGKIIMGADGYKSIVARNLNLYEHDPEHWVVALRCYYRNVGDLQAQIELHFIDEVIPGYFWIFPVGNGQANVGIGMLHKAIRRKNIDLKQLLFRAIQSPAFRHRFVSATPLEKPVGWNLPVGSKHRRNYGNGFLLLGDAAGLIDPFTGEGIGNALYSAKVAVETARQALSVNNFSSGLLSRYDQSLWSAIGNELKVSTRLQKLGQSRFLLNLVINKAARNPEVSRIIAGMMTNEIPRRQLTNPLFYLRLLCH